MDDEPAEVASHGKLEEENSPYKNVKDLEFSLFYRSQIHAIVAFLIVQGARPAIAAELAQETMIEAYRSWENIDSPRAWIRRVASRKWWRQVDRESTESLQSDIPEGNILVSSEEAVEIENRCYFVALVRQLPLRQRQIMAWIYAGYSPAEIAQELGMNAATVRANLRKARDRLADRRTRLEDER